MRNLILLSATIVLLTSCGMADRIASDCGGEHKSLCQAIFGETPSQVDELADEVDAIKAQIEQLENQNASLLAQVGSLQSQTASLTSQLVATQNTVSILQAIVTSLDASNTAQHAALQAQITALQNQAASVQTQITSTSSNLTVVQNQVNQNVAQIAVLNGFTHVTEIIDVCGDHPTKFDEVLLRIYRPSTNSYAILASFSDNANGLNTRFSIVPQGSFGTTDGTGCSFQVGPAPAFVVTW
jgi:septal ring factor EnvC (AmiA/AmiB activator)